MSDDELKNKDENNTEPNDKSFDDLKDSTDDIVGEKSSKDKDTVQETELPEKTETEIELERVESIESKDLASQSPDKTEDFDDKSDESFEDTENEVSDDNSHDSVETDSDNKASNLPVSLPEDNKKKVSLDDIIKRQDTEKKAKKRPVVWIVLTFLFLIIALGVGALYYVSFDQHDKDKASLQSQIDDEKSKNSSLSNQLVEVQKSLAEKINSEKKDEEKQAETSSDQYLTIPEWGVQYKKTDNNADLTYSYSVYDSGDVKVQRLSFSTLDISTIREKTGQSVSYPCSSSAAPVGYIDRYTKEELEAVKKFVAGTPMATTYDDAVKNGNYYYTTGTAQNACSTQLNKTDYSAKLKVVQALPALFEAIATPKQ